MRVRVVCREATITRECLRTDTRRQDRVLQVFCGMLARIGHLADIFGDSRQQIKKVSRYKDRLWYIV